MTHDLEPPKPHRPENDRAIQFEICPNRVDDPYIDDEPKYSHDIIPSGLKCDEIVPGLFGTVRAIADATDTDRIDAAIRDGDDIPPLARAEYDANRDELTVDLNDDHPAFNADEVEIPDEVITPSNDLRTIQVDRVELIRAAQMSALNDHRNDVVLLKPDGAYVQQHTRLDRTRVIYPTILVDTFVADHHTCIETIREDWISGELTTTDMEQWADAIELRDEIPAHLTTIGEPIRVEYIDGDECD